MANVDAFNDGFNAGNKKSKKNKDAPPKKPKPVKEITTNDGDKLYPSVAKPSTFKKGGKVKRTGIAKVHKGEYVLTAKKAKKMKSSTRKRVASKR